MAFQFAGCCSSQSGGNEAVFVGIAKRTNSEHNWLTSGGVEGGLNVCLQVLYNAVMRNDDSGIERKEVRSICLLESRLFDVDWLLNLQSATRPNNERQPSGVASKSQIDKLV